MSLTEQQIKEYVARKGNRCPYCQSENIEGTGERNSDADWHENGVQCNDCDRTWHDVYTLTGIREDD